MKNLNIYQNYDSLLDSFYENLGKGNRTMRTDMLLSKDDLLSKNGKIDVNFVSQEIKMLMLDRNESSEAVE